MRKLEAIEAAYKAEQEMKATAREQRNTVTKIAAKAINLLRAIDLSVLPEEQQKEVANFIQEHKKFR